MSYRYDILGTPTQQTPINFTGSGDQTLVAAMPGYKLAILQFFFVVSAPVTLIYKSGTTAMSGPMAFLANGAQVQDFIELPLLCSDNDPFVLNASTSVTLGGIIWWSAAPSIR
jgi:hypothetical protein